MKNQRTEQLGLQRVFRLTNLVLAMAVMALPSWASTGNTAKNADDLLLEQRVTERISTQNLNLPTDPQATTPARKPTFRDLRFFKAMAEQKVQKCVDVKTKEFGKKYVLSFDSNSKPCRIYDLSFPTLQSIFRGQKALQVPVQDLTSKDYLNWMDGNHEALAISQERFKQNFNARLVARTSWVSKLRFRKMPEAVEGSKLRATEVGLPKSFRLSDLELGRRFQIDGQTQLDARALEVNTPFNDVLSQPESLLSAVRFDWNELDKVYDVILDGSFLPLNGPVALVDYQVQYKYAVDKLFRSILSDVFRQMARVVPIPMVSSLAEVVIHDVFEQIDMAYEYQMLQLEDTLRMGAKGLMPVEIDAATSLRGLNLVFGQRADLISSYMMSVAAGQPFDWQAFEKIGKAERYNIEKQRDIMMSKMNSKLVLDKGCTIDYVKDTFAVCTRAGQKDAIYSLTSEQVVFNKHFGAPLVYRFDRPSEVTLRRGGTWLLSAGLRVFGLPIARQITYGLNGILKNYIFTGLLDESFLKNSLNQQAAQSQLTAEEASLLKWLYIQNLNPFLPKSQATEQRLIEVNRQLLAEQLH